MTQDKPKPDRTEYFRKYHQRVRKVRPQLAKYQKRAPETKFCSWCGAPFEALMPWSAYCKPAHRQMAARKRRQEREATK